MREYINERGPFKVIVTMPDCKVEKFDADHLIWSGDGFYWFSTEKLGKSFVSVRTPIQYTIVQELRKQKEVTG